MGKGRLEAFSDGVIAIIITIMVLEMKVPHETSVAALLHLMPVFLSYALSYVFVGIYWSNHHHMLHVSQRVNGATLWANLHFLFWLSLVPLATGWLGENSLQGLPVALYGVVLLMCSIAYVALARTLVRLHGKESPLAKALGRDMKGHVSMALYLVAIGSAFISTWLALALYLGIAAMWLVPDRRIEKVAAE
ncbi:TMEM175 family protein [Ralstonia sp. 25C]|uniref:TMEM175 family protein n=1 Tax=Ralstonia sp. 25C TaxID=3447363 RepID=UPI003F74F903